jgi:hypothetical protein
MKLYRVLKPLSVGEKIFPAGAVVELASLSDYAKIVLVKRGAIREITPPPLATVPGWKVRAEKLQKIGIVTPYDLCDAEKSDVARHMRVTTDTVQKWQLDAIRALIEPVTPRRPGA